MASLNLQLDIADDAVATSAVDETSVDPVDAHQGVFQLALDDMQHEADAMAFSIDSPSHFRQRHIQIHVMDRRFKYPTWMHPNIGGEAQHLSSSEEDIIDIQKKIVASKHNLSEWTSTAISGNDILSSVLFTTGLTTAKAGKLAPVAQAVVIFVIFCLRRVMEEVMSAVPLNGGCYSAILNSSSKRVAAISAVFSMLSYLATGVVCGVAAFNYLNTLVAVPVVSSTVGMLLGFALLCLLGIAESAVVALVFFLVHGLTLTILCITSIIYAAQNPSIFAGNMHTAIPDVSVWGDILPGNVMTAIFYGYGTAMLGVTGFEASAQFIEEQALGVFPKTLRNMWVVSSFYNFAFSFLALAVVPMEGAAGIIANKDVLLAHMGRITAGHWLEILVSIDAFVVLAGAVLTSYVGITGLAHRLAIDRVLPRILTRTNSCRGTAHNVIVAYFLAASSLVIAMNGKIDGLSGVFAFAFLGVLGSFGVGCLLLKVYREDMPRHATTSWLNCVFCLVMITICFIANALNDPNSFGYFLLYYVAIGSVAFIMLERVWMLKTVLEGTRRFHKWWNPPAPIQQEVIGSLIVAKRIEKIKRTPAIFFCKAPNLPKINEAISYVLKNEQTYCLRLVHVAQRDGHIPSEFEDIVCLFDHIYPGLKIDFVSIQGSFEPSMIAWIVEHLHVPTNMMFMRQPTTPEMHAVAGVGVRVITS
ncbi:hypothetical protein Poli38472_003419 [Pythium oligandrum]|uniref:Uncharacterized protein n=1 Tax=Pythium oligandrum TaxID=41045 RepID=A0A8K1FE18_PYTOL|nr:hypothetical protein Poli38472_003419 [Pythium oligandrum]|eukprot:TMW57494.1 hypothetical protein Poli38472_003419 [Pythium oligandrum]